MLGDTSGARLVPCQVIRLKSLPTNPSQTAKFHSVSKDIKESTGFSLHDYSGLGLEAKASLRSLSPETMMVPNLDLLETSGDVPSFSRICVLSSLLPCLLSKSVSGWARVYCRVSTESHQGPCVEFQVPI